MKVLLTGATGMVGYQVLQVLNRRKIDTRILDLNTEKNKMILKNQPNEIFWGDLRDFSIVLKAVKGVEIIFHLGAMIPPAADEFPDIAEEVNVLGTKHILKAIKESNQNVILFYASSVSVYGDRLHGEDLSVGDPLTPAPFDAYAKTKIQAEEAIVASGIPYVIYRLSAVMGPRPGVHFRDRLDPLMYHMPLATNIELVTSRDVGFAFAESLTHLDELKNKIFNLAGGKEMRITYYSFLQESLDAYGLKLKKFPNFVFAEKNFHCGYYKDSYLLHDILHFQRDTLNSYFAWVDPHVRWWMKSLVKLFHPFVVRSMVKKSEIYQAIESNNESMIKRFLHFNPNKFFHKPKE